MYSGVRSGAYTAQARRIFPVWRASPEDRESCRTRHETRRRKKSALARRRQFIPKRRAMGGFAPHQPRAGWTLACQMRILNGNVYSGAKGSPRNLPLSPREGHRLPEKGLSDTMNRLRREAMLANRQVRTNPGTCNRRIFRSFAVSPATSRYAAKTNVVHFGKSECGQKRKSPIAIPFS